MTAAMVPLALRDDAQQFRKRYGRSADVMIAAALTGLVAFLYRKVLRLWWMYDDAFLINLLRPSTVLGTLHDHALYAKPGRPIFNPLLMLSWKLDLEAFGLNAQALYAHQLFSLALLAVCLYFLLRLWCSAIVAAIVSIIFICSGPTLEVVPQLMLRHYIEGAVFATAAAIAFVVAIRRGSWRLSIASAFLYFCGAAAKEVYAPLILILIVIPEGSVRQRLRLAIPHAVVAVGFIVWRILLIGWSVAPFGFVVPAEKRPLTIATIRFRLVRQFARLDTYWCVSC